MIAVISLVALFHAATPASQGCVVSDWSNWSMCRCPRNVPNKAGQSHLVAPPVNIASPKMPEVMRLKLERKRQLAACRAEGLCEGVLQTSQRGAQACVGGMSGEYPCLNVDLLSQVSVFDLGAVWSGAEGNDIWGWSDPVTMEDYAIVGTTHGTSFVRVNTPEYPEVLAFMATSGPASVWRDMKVVGNFVFVVSEASSHGMQVFDLRRLRYMTELDFAAVNPDVVYNGFKTAHNIVANPQTNTVYVVGANTCNGGLEIIDISDPLIPWPIGCFRDDGYVHDAQCLNYNGPDTAYQGREICFCYNEDTLTIVDVTDKINMQMISRTPYGRNEYTHQGWLSESQAVLLLDDELDEYYATTNANRRVRTLVWDISSLSNPQMRTEYFSPEMGIDHNMYTKGRFVYQSNYGTGLRILELDEASFQLTEVAYFDVHPVPEASPDFVGTWSNYPYFQYGAKDTIAVGSIERGLFMLRPNLPAADAAKMEPPVISGSQERTRQILRGANQEHCPSSQQVRTCTHC